jgi:hypothetical protein
MKTSKEPKFMCNCCHEHFPKKEMDFDVDNDQDLCKNCNYQSYNDAPYKTFEDYQEYYDGYCFKDNEAFVGDVTAICYIPENAVGLDDCFTYLDLKSEVEEWKKENEDYFTEHQTDVNSVLTNMFESLSWEFPSTFLEQLNY